jgi:hippurate hydrolase
MSAGTASNVIPETVKMTGTLRAVSEGARKHVIDAMGTLVKGIASAYDMTAELAVNPGYPVTVNDDACAAFLLRVAGDVVGADATGTMPAPVMGAEDFSYVLQERAGALAFLGVCPPGVNPVHAHSCHSNRMMLHEEAMCAGVAVYAAVGMAYLAELNGS